MVVVGSGAIGVEFAYFYKLHWYQGNYRGIPANIVPVEDEEVSKQLEKIYKKAGMKIMTSSEVTNVDTSGKGCKVTVKTKKGEEQIEVRYRTFCSGCFDQPRRHRAGRSRR